MGYAVYDTDRCASALMNESPVLRERLTRHFGELCYDAHGLNRAYLASVVFNDAAQLSALNSIVHPDVIRDILDWKSWVKPYPAFVETAILYQSGLDKIVDSVWEVTADQKTRIQRVMARSGLSYDQVAARIRSQQYNPDSTHPDVKFIVNDRHTALMPQILRLLEREINGSRQCR